MPSASILIERSVFSSGYNRKGRGSAPRPCRVVRSQPLSVISNPD